MQNNRQQTISKGKNHQSGNKQRLQLQYRKLAPPLAVVPNQLALSSHNYTDYSPNPSYFNPAPIRRQHLRYNVTLNSVFDITIGGLLSSKMIATTATNAQTLYYVFRLILAEAWSPVQTQGLVVTNSFQPIASESSDNSFASPGVLISDSSNVIDRPAYIRYKPKVTTPTGAWHRSTSVNASLMTAELPNGSILDLIIEYVENFDKPPQGFARTSSGMTVGQMYSGNLAANVISQGVNLTG